MKWPIYPLSSISIDLQPGFARLPKTGHASFPQLRTNNVSAEGRIDFALVKEVPASLNECKRYSLQKGDILFNNTNSVDLVGKTAFFDSDGGPYLFSNHMTRIRVNEKIADPRFIARILFWDWKTGGFRMMVTRWVNQAAINRTMLGSLSVPLPALSEQRRIVEILDQADALRKKRAEADAKASCILPALFCKMFGDPATNPKEWPVMPLGELGDLDRGRSRHRPRNAPELLGGPYPFIQTGDVANSQGYIRAYSSTYSELGLAQSKVWPAGTLCITIAASIAATAILGFDSCFPDSVVGFKPGPKTNSEYVRVLLTFLKPILERSAPQVAQKNINLKILREMPVQVPPTDILNRFKIQHDRAMLLDEKRLKSGHNLEILWKSLLHRAFTGDLTAKWREAHMKELLAEMHLQSQYYDATEAKT